MTSARWSISACGEIFHEEFETREAAEADGRSYYPGSSFYVALVQPSELPKKVPIDFEDLDERLSEHFYDDGICSLHMKEVEALEKRFQEAWDEWLANEGGQVHPTALHFVDGPYQIEAEKDDSPNAG